MDLFEIQLESDLQKTFHQQFHKRISIQDNQHNYTIFGFDKCFTKRCKSLFKNFAIPFQQTNQFDNKQLISSCECLDCGGKVNKKILICKKELIDQLQSNTKSRLPASPQLSIQPQNVRPSNRDLSLIGSSTIQKSNRVSIMPVIQLIQAQNLMKKISATHKIEKDTKTKMSISTHSIFNKVQQKQIINKDNDNDKLRSVLEIETNQNKKEEINKQSKQTPNYCQFRIKTEGSNYYFASIKQKQSIINIPKLYDLENIKKNSLSIFESKTPRLLLNRSEKYNQKQPLSQRLMCTYLKKQNTNSKLIKNNNNKV